MGECLTADTTLMFSEARASGASVAALFVANRAVLREIAAELRASPPATVITCARGSSDNAATYARYLIETQLGIVTGSMGLSVASLYEAPLRVPGGLCIAISQSGASPDLMHAVALARAGGARTIALVNAVGAPIATQIDDLIALSAGPEHSVAATKSFIASLVAVAWIVGLWRDDRTLLTALEQLPDHLDEAWSLDWSAALDVFADADHAFVLGRGPGLAIAQEGALKLKETSSLHAEALSAAEVEHGPMALVDAHFPLLVFAQRDQSHAHTAELVGRMVARGAPVYAAGIAAAGAISLPVVRAHPLLEPILQVQSFYRFAAELSVARGNDPDRPPHLRKVTKTL